AHGFHHGLSERGEGKRRRWVGGLLSSSHTSLHSRVRGQGCGLHHNRETRPAYGGHRRCSRALSEFLTSPSLPSPSAAAPPPPPPPPPPFPPPTRRGAPPPPPRASAPRSAAPLRGLRAPALPPATDAR